MQRYERIGKILIFMGRLIMIFILRLPCRRFVMPLSSSEIQVKWG